MLYVKISATGECARPISGILRPLPVKQSDQKKCHMPTSLEHQFPISQDRGELAKMVMTLLEHWKLTIDDQASLLANATSNRSALTRYRKGKSVVLNLNLNLSSLITARYY